MSIGAGQCGEDQRTRRMLLVRALEPDGTLFEPSFGEVGKANSPKKEKGPGVSRAQPHRPRAPLDGDSRVSRPCVHIAADAACNRGVGVERGRPIDC